MAESRAQRRLAAILAADVVGYSRLMETDETGTLVSPQDAASRHHRSLHRLAFRPDRQVDG